MVWGYRNLKDGSTEYCYAKGNAVCDGFEKYTGDGILENPSVGGRQLGYAIRLLPGGGWERVVPVDVQGQGRSWLSQKDIVAINAVSAGALCSLSGGLACPSSMDQGISDRVRTAGDIAQIPFLVKSLLAAGLSMAAIAIVLKKEPEVIAKLVANLTEEAAKLDRNGLTFAGRSLQKHMSRPGSIYPQVPQTVDSLNDTGATIVKQILDNPDTVYRTNRLGGIDAIVPDGFGIRYNKNGSFRSFLEP